MNDPIDVAQFLSELADDNRLYAELADASVVEINARLTLQHEFKRRASLCQARRVDGNRCQRYPVRGGTMCSSHRHLEPMIPAQAVDSPPVDAREHAIDALIAAVSDAPATAIRETLGAVLDEFRVNALAVDFERLEQRLRETDQ